MTAVEWLIDRIAEVSVMEKGRYYIPYNSGTIDITHIIEQAKQMEKEQIEDAHVEGQRVFDKHPHTQWTNDQAEHYYAETYGSNGNFKQFSLYEHKETIATTNTPTSSQTEISDEEIEKAMLDRSDLWDDPLCFEIGWKDAIKWYREQLKQRQ